MTDSVPDWTDVNAKAPTPPRVASESELHTILHEWNNTAKEYPLHICLHAWIEKQVERTPERTALTFEGQSMSYDAVNRRANQLALYLQSIGIEPNMPVGICTHRSFEMVIGLLAVLKAGAAFLPIDPTYPSERIQFLIQDSRLRILLTQSTCLSLLPPTDANVLPIDASDAPFLHLPTHNPTSAVTPQDLAYVIYTSGSTGKPKGAMNTHAGIVNRLLWMRDTFALTAQDSVLQKTPFSFDVSLWEFFWPLMNGGRLVIARPNGHKDTGYLLDIIESEKITRVHFVPSMLRLFLAVADRNKTRSLRDVFCSGEALPADLQQRFFDTLDARLHNLYGPTEAAVEVTYWMCRQQGAAVSVPIGRPISNMRIYILDGRLQHVPPGEIGEIHIGGIGVARGYLNRPELTREKFIPDPYGAGPSDRLYKTGDLGRFNPDGVIEYLGRIDNQVKIRGFRVEPAEIEAEIARDPMARDCVVIAREDSPGMKRLIAYVAADPGQFSIASTRQRLQQTLPEYMVPASFVVLRAFPLNPNGKLDRAALPKPEKSRPDLAQAYIVPGTTLERTLAKVWADLLGLDKVGVDDNFFDLGGDSLQVLRMVADLQQQEGIKLPVVKVFQYPTVGALAAFLQGEHNGISLIESIDERATRQRIGRFSNDPMRDGVAIIGMAGRFPGAPTLRHLWENLCNGVESISFFSPDELSPGIEDYLKDDPDYVRARGIIENADMFDASFFGIGPLEAESMDPQQRIFLQMAWTALENAGYDSESYSGVIGVYAGVGDTNYYSLNVLSHPDLLRTVGKLVVLYGNQKDYIATRVSYAMNLTGPSVSANTGCSSSLLAVDNAFNALLDFECDMALAGGVDILIPQKSGFLYQPDGAFSKDGHCRPFDAEATGTMFCDGAGMVVLKRLQDALADGDTMYGVLRSTAKNNDGANKISFLAPSVNGQSQVVALALARANLSPEDIGYIEAHGTGTPLGDPIEIEALTKAFRQKTAKKQFCRIGSMKGNIGHPSIAAGIAGLLKATLSLYHEKIPGTLHYRKANPRIDFEESPFRVVDRLTPWPRAEKTRIAGVSAFGFGGTNVHAIVAEAPPCPQSGVSRPRALLLLSAKTPSALETATENLRNFVQQMPDTNAADMAFTLTTGRRPMAHRRFAVCSDARGAMDILGSRNPLRFGTHHCQQRDPQIVFMFPGQGSQYVNMGLSLYSSEPVFRQAVDRCCDILKGPLDRDLREILYPAHQNEQSAYESLKSTFFTQPAIFTIEYALALLWQHWGVKPSRMIGHSVGEFVCACLSGVFKLNDALRLVALRGKLIQSLPRGSMLSVRCSAAQLSARLPADIQLAAINGPALCVISGTEAAIAELERDLKRDSIIARPLHTSHAFHSAMMDPIVDDFTAAVAQVELCKPRISFVSTATGQLIRDEQAIDPAYWGRHLRMPVRFSDGVRILLQQQEAILLEVGPRNTLTALAQQHFHSPMDHNAVASLGDTTENHAEWEALLCAVGQLWCHGVTIDWKRFYGGEKRRHIPLPTYPFEEKSYWVDPAVVVARATPEAMPSAVARDFPAQKQPTAQPCAGSDQSPAEKMTARLRELFTEISGISGDRFHADATFLELGMDSLLLTQIASKLQKDLGVKIAFSQLMKEYPTIPILATHLASVVPETEVPMLAITVKEEATTISPSIPQQGIWLSSMLTEELSCSYNESMTLRLAGGLDIEVAREAVQALFQRHDALRGIFSADGKSMTITATTPLDIPVTDLTSCSDAERENRLKAALATEAATPFDLEHGPLFRSRILKMQPDLHFVTLTAHHIICDGWSLDVLIHDFCALYTAKIKKSVPALEPMKSYAEYSALVHQRTDSPDFARDRAYWRRLYADGLPALRLPSDFPRTAVRSYAARRIDRTLSRRLVSALQQLGIPHGCSLFVTVVAGLSAYLHRLSGQEDFILGLPTAEQPLIGQTGLVGQCVNLLPLRCSLGGDPTFIELLQRTRGAFFEACEHQSYTFIHLLDDLQSVGADGRNPALSVGLTGVKKWGKNELPCPQGLDIDYNANAKSYESFEMYLNAVMAGSDLVLNCHYQIQLFTEWTIQRRLSQLESFLELVVEQPASRLSSLPIAIDAAETPQGDFTFNRSRPGATKIGPRNTIERDLFDLWKKLLGDSIKSIDDNFFDFGGHSLLAARLFAEIARLLGRSVPLSLLFRAPTIRRLAASLMDAGSAASWNLLVPIQPQGSKRPLFLIHGAEGNVLLYRELARQLGSDRPVYGFQSAGLDGNESLDPALERVAARYIAEIRSVQPTGPYHLGGYCLGGTIALEIAHQLRRQGETIGVLAMIENYNIRSIKWPQPFYLRWSNSFLNAYFHAANVFAAQKGYKYGFLRQKLNVEIQRMKTSGGIIVSRMLKSFGVKSALQYHHVRVDKAYDYELTRYSPPQYPGTITLFAAKHHFIGFRDPLCGWGGVAREVRIHKIAVNPRGTLLEPYVSILAQELHGALELCDEQSKSSHDEKPNS